jgi:maltokinase
VNAELEQFIGGARWFGGKGRGHRLATVQRLGTLRDDTDGPVVAVMLATVEYDDAAEDSAPARETYQVPLALYTDAQERLEHAYVGSWEDEELGEVLAYDALHDREATKLWLRAFAAGTRTDGLVFHRVPGHELDLDTHSTIFSGEQSNSSVAFGEDSLMKVFRKVSTGRNPDIEIHEALTRAEVENVPALYGWLEAPSPDGTDEGPLQLAMLQQFLRTVSDGWDLALVSVRDLYAEADLHAEEVGGDFAAESHRLGLATAHVHDALATCFPTGTWSGPDLAALAEAMSQRLDAALEAVPQLAEHADGLRATFGQLSKIDEPVPVQRIHGDFHLGQTLRTVKGWKIVDFEGEPAKPLAERMRPDSRWRDVAGMLRSFDYAAHAVELDVETSEEARQQIAYRANEWAVRNQDAFVAGYVEGLDESGSTGLSEAERLLLRAYQADKAVYETVYEARNRPDWIGIPLGALTRLATTTDEEANGR